MEGSVDLALGDLTWAHILLQRRLRCIPIGALNREVRPGQAQPHIFNVVCRTTRATQEASLRMA